MKEDLEKGSIIEKFQSLPFLRNYEHAKELADDFGVPVEDVLLISLNCSGIHRGNKLINRGRFTINTESGRSYRMAITFTDTPLSPFHENNGDVYLDDKVIGAMGTVSKDTCTDSYYRKGKKHLTLNSNSRGKCKGCEFCGTYSLDNQDPPLTSSLEMRKRVRKLSAELGGDLSRLESIAVVTGCFPKEEELINHLLMIRRFFKEAGFFGEIQYIGSQLRRLDAIAELAQEGPLAYYLSVECFENRESILKPEKASLTLNGGRNLLRELRTIGVETSFLYITGLDSPSVAREELVQYRDVVTRLPLIETFQLYQPEQIILRNEAAARPEYFLQIRQAVEDCFPRLRPDLNMNYRGLWYSQYSSHLLENPEL